MVSMAWCNRQRRYPSRESAPWPHGGLTTCKRLGRGGASGAAARSLAETTLGSGLSSGSGACRQRDGDAADPRARDVQGGEGEPGVIVRGAGTLSAPGGVALFPTAPALGLSDRAVLGVLSFLAPAAIRDLISFTKPSTRLLNCFV
mmetsp:Transcript_25312/g.58524  ORF Transcript_25312/g.58524 Transcript_25312/m.58524 type:complete len:146 (-) Transcript_25312:608-1045(-)